MMPTLEELMRRLAETPPEFCGEPRLSNGAGEIVVSAVVADVLRDYGAAPTLADVAPFNARSVGDRNFLRLVLVGAWLISDGRLQGGVEPSQLIAWLESLRQPATLVLSDLFVTDQERREELVRRLFQAADVLPPGETAEEAGYRLSAVDCVHRHEVMRQTVEARKRAEELRRKMKEERAREAAARYSRE